MSGRAGSLFLPGLAVAALAGAMALQIARDQAYPRDGQAEETLLYVRSGTALQRLALEFDALASDVYWIRAIQHFGRERLSDVQQRGYELLYPLLDITTTLDPYFTIAYRFGAIFLSEEYPGGPGRPDQAIALLEKGIGVQPQKWEYYHDIGFVHYWHFRDYAAAAAWFQRAGALPNAPTWLQPLAAAMLNAGGNRDSARVIFRQLLQSEEAWLRRIAAWRLQQLDALDQIERLEQIVRRNPPPPGEPYSWEFLARRGVLPGVPLDPARTPYLLDPESGIVSVATNSPLQPMPHEAFQRLPPR